MHDATLNQLNVLALRVKGQSVSTRMALQQVAVLIPDKDVNEVLLAMATAMLDAKQEAAPFVTALRAKENEIVALAATATDVALSHQAEIARVQAEWSERVAQLQRQVALHVTKAHDAEAKRFQAEQQLETTNAAINALRATASQDSQLILDLRREGTLAQAAAASERQKTLSAKQDHRAQLLVVQGQLPPLQRSLQSLQTSLDAAGSRESVLKGSLAGQQEEIQSLTARTVRLSTQVSDATKQLAQSEREHTQRLETVSKTLQSLQDQHQRAVRILSMRPLSETAQGQELRKILG